MHSVWQGTGVATPGKSTVRPYRPSARRRLITRSKYAGAHAEKVAAEGRPDFKSKKVG